MIVVAPYDEVSYHGRPCRVEETWTTTDETHTPFCALRPIGEEDSDGVYIVEQSAAQPLTGS